MYISKLMLNPDDYKVQKDLSNPYELHRTILRGFPENLDYIKRQGRVLYRINKNKDNNNPVILIQSEVGPNWEYLAENAYLNKKAKFKQFKYPKFQQGNKYWFKIFGNPTKKVKGKRIGLYNENDQYQWLNRKGELGGFNLSHILISRKEEITAKKPRNSKKMTFIGVEFQGILQVNKPKKFIETLKKGIGSGKAFGFGFLTISKI